MRIFQTVFFLMTLVYVPGSHGIVPLYSTELPAAVHGERLSTFEPADRAGLYPIVSKTPAPDFFEGALLGNGGMGVVVCTRPDAVVLRFGHNNVWDIRISESTKGKTGTFRELFDRISALPDTLKSLNDNAWYREYSIEMREDYSKPYPRPFPCGSVILWFDRRKAELTGHRLNIESGICEISFLIDNEVRTLNIFTDQLNDRLWANMADGDGYPAPFPFREIEVLPDHTTPEAFPPYETGDSGIDHALTFKQVLPFSEITEPGTYHAHPRDRAFRLSAAVSGKLINKKRLTWEGTYEYPGPLTRAVEGNGSFTLCVSLEQGLNSDITGKGETAAPSLKEYNAALGESKRSWDEYWSKSGIALDDTLLERTWYHNLYFLRCALRPGAVCPGLFANWSYGAIGTAWHGDYHLNYNTQQPFWAVFSCNHPELNIPYVDMVHHILPVSRKWAREYYGLRGAFFPHSSYPVEMTTMPYPLPTWGWEIFETPWTVQGLWWHYLYTQDKNLLRDRLFEPVKEAVLFLADYMMRSEARGEQWDDDDYHIFPSVPPELYGLRPDFDKNYDTIADLTLTKFIFNAYIEACEALGKTKEEGALLKNVRDILAHFPEYPTAESERGTVFVSVKGEDPATVYNVPVSLMPVFPGDDIGLHSARSAYEIAETTYRNQQNEGGNDLVFLNVQAARLGIMDVEKFKRQIEYCLLPNGTCTDKVLQVHGRYSNTTPFDFMADMGIWFENFGLPLVINECLLQSYNGTLRFFPNWPDEKFAEFRDLRAAGAFLVSARWSSGTVGWVEITSEAGNELRIISPWKEGALCRRGNQEIPLKDDVLTLETRAGETLRFFPVE